MDDEEISINLKILSSAEPASLSVPRNLTIGSLRTLAADFTDLPPDRVRLLFNGRALLDTQNLTDHDITNGSVIRVVPLRPSPVPPPTFANFRGVRASIVRFQDTIGRLLLSIATLQQQLNGDGEPPAAALSEFQALAQSSLSRVIQVRDEVADFFNPQPSSPAEAPRPRTEVADTEIEVPRIQPGTVAPARPIDDEPEVPRVKAPTRPALILTEEELAIVNRDVEEMRTNPIVVHFDSLYRPGRVFEDNFDFT
jgi:hypothetical protein